MLHWDSSFPVIQERREAGISLTIRIFLRALALPGTRRVMEKPVSAVVLVCSLTRSMAGCRIGPPTKPLGPAELCYCPIHGPRSRPSSRKRAKQDTLDPYVSVGSADPFPSKIPPPSNVDFDAAGFLPLGPGNNFVDVHLKTPYIYQYNLSFQRQLANGVMAELGYAGSSSHNLLTWVDQNPMILGTTTRLFNQGSAG